MPAPPGDGGERARSLLFRGTAVSAPDPCSSRMEREQWERAARGWGRHADRVRAWGMPVAAWMIEHLELQPGERVLELAAGPGDVGFMAAELISPGGVLISSDASEAMLEVARERAARQRVEGVEFRQLQLEWIDLETASVDAILCRWGLMLCSDPAAAAQECRRVLRPGGRIALAVWDQPEANPWATVPRAALEDIGAAPATDPGAPGPFALSAPGRLEQVLLDAGFLEPLVERVAVERRYRDLDQYVQESLELSPLLQDAWGRLDQRQQAQLLERMRKHARPYLRADGSLLLPGRSICALAHA
jgi:SAM-dependent methyltransferase